MPFLNLADGPIPEHLHRHTIRHMRMNLNAHLRNHLRLPRRQDHLPGFIHFMRQRFLAIHMLAFFDRRHRDRGVHMIGGRDIDGIDFIALFFQQFPPVTILTGIGQARRRLIQIILIHITDRHHVQLAAGQQASHIPAPHPAYTDTGVLQLAVGGLTKVQTGHNQGKGDTSGNRLLNERSTGYFFTHRHYFLIINVYDSSFAKLL